ncbi:MAG: response regulator [Peptococcaceae bacterium]
MYRVFIVEDDPMVLNINQKYVSRLSQFEVAGMSGSGNEALRKITELQPDLVLLDVFMPEKDGIEVLHQIRNLAANTEVILLTAAHDTDTITQAFRLGALDYIIKPYEFSRLNQALDSFLQRKSALSGTGTLTQKELDKLQTVPKNNPAPTAKQRLPKGFDQITLEKVRSVLSQTTNPISTKEVADSLNLSRITIRRYLEFLADSGEITVDLEYGKMGRPTKVYALH